MTESCKHFHDKVSNLLIFHNLPAVVTTSLQPIVWQHTVTLWPVSPVLPEDVSIKLVCRVFWWSRTDAYSRKWQIVWQSCLWEVRTSEDFCQRFSIAQHYGGGPVVTENIIEAKRWRITEFVLSIEQLKCSFHNGMFLCIRCWWLVLSDVAVILIG